MTWLNPVAERMTGWLHAEATEKPSLGLSHRAGRHPTARGEPHHAVPGAKGGSAGWRLAPMLISRDGREMAIEDSAAPICNEAGELLGAVLVFHDVTEQRRLSGEMT